MPYAYGFAARRLGWLTPDGDLDKKRTGRALKQLVEAGVLVQGEPLGPNGKRYRTRTYAPAKWATEGQHG